MQFISNWKYDFHEYFSMVYFFSPSVLYISQSLLHSDLSMFYRLAHEVCHTWFGIVIGPLDWTEEWLTEGFCTYLEDIIHTRVLKVKKKSSSVLSSVFVEFCWVELRKEVIFELQRLITNCINKIICNEFMSNLFLTESPLHLYQYDTNMYSTKQYRLK